MPKLQPIVATIREDAAEGWWLTIDDGAPVLHETAACALRAVTRLAQDMAEGGQSSVARIEWESLSWIGRLVVKALTNTK